MVEAAFAVKTKRGPKPMVLLKRLNVGAGAWQIFWYGKLTDQPSATRTPFIRAYLTQVELAEGRISRYLPAVTHVDLPISDITALPLGTVFDDQVVIPALPLHPASQWRSITVDFTRENLHVTTRVAAESDGHRFLSPGVRTRTTSTDSEYEGLLLAAGDADNPCAFLFPCAAIFQFFWARSSKWAQLMVDGRFVDYNRHIFDAKRSYINDDRSEASIWLRQRMIDDDARFIASLAFDEYALSAGADIYRHLAQAPRDAELRCLRALPPYQGSIQLWALVQPIITRHGPSTLVQAITRCHYTPSIKKLTFDRDNDGRTLDEMVQGIEKIPMERQQFGGPVVSLLDSPAELANEPHTNNTGMVEIEVPQFSDMFPEFEDIKCEKLPQLETTYANTQDLAAALLSRWSGVVSSLEEASSSADLAHEALLRGRDHSNSLGDDDPMPVRGDIALLARSLLGGKAFKFSVGRENWTAKPQRVVMPSQVGEFFRVPDQVDDCAMAWLFRDKEKRYRKRALCIRVTFSPEPDETASTALDFTRYFLDFEPRDTSGIPRQTSILFFWHVTNTPLENEVREVNKLVDAIAKKGQAGVSLSRMDDLAGCTRHHPPSVPGGTYLSDDVIVRFLQSLFSAEPRV